MINVRSGVTNIPPLRYAVIVSDLLLKIGAILHQLLVATDSHYH